MKYKVLFIMHMPPPVHGAAMMGKYIHDSKLINETFECRYINPSASSNIKEVGKLNIGKFFFLFKNSFKIIRTVIKGKPDLCYYTPTSTGWGIYRDMVVITLLKMFGKNVVLHFHNKGVKDYSHRHPLSTIAYKLMFSNVKVIQLSELLYQDIQQFISKDKVFFCANGIPESFGSELSLFRNNSIPKLLFLSNLLVEKGVLVLLDACEILRKKGYQFFCDFVGGETVDINNEYFQKECIQRNIKECIFYHGKKCGSEKYLFFQQTDIFILPTFNECFPLVILEAMEYKLPVISTNEGGIPDVIKDGENGLISIKKDPQSLADCIEKLLINKDLRYRMGEAGYQKFKKYYTLPVFEKKFTSILMQCINN